MNTLPSILIAEDDDATRTVLKALLTHLGYPIAGVARDGREAVEKTLALNPGALLLDIGMPVLDGLEAARLILARQSVPIVILTGSHDEETLAQARRIGVQAFLLKPLTQKDQLRSAIDIATTLWTQQRANAALIAALSADLRAAHAPAPPLPSLASYRLTQRETEVLQLVWEGRTNLEIGAQLGLSPRTAEKHIENILDKLGVKSRACIARIVGQAMSEQSRIGKHSSKLGMARFNPEVGVADLVEMNPRVAKVKVAIETMHRCTARHVDSKPVIDTFLGHMVWGGMVETFDITGHPRARRCHAWSYDEDDETKYVTVLELPPVNSPEAAVRMAIGGLGSFTPLTPVCA